MGYPEKLLNSGEQVAIDVRPHWKYLAGPVFATAVVLVGAIVALVENAPNWAELAVAALLLVCLAWLAGRYVKWATTSFVVTNERLILRKGVLHRSGREILLNRMTDISCNQTLLDRITGCGDILLESPGRDSQEVFPDLPHPLVIQKEIYQLITSGQAPGLPAAAGAAAGGPSGAPSSGAPTSGPTSGAPAPWSVTGSAATPAGAPGQAGADGTAGTLADQLNQLDDLRRRKVISRKEFAAKKAELLSRM